MKKEFIFNIFLLFVINVMVKLTYLFLIEVNVQNTVGPKEYGLFLALFNFSYLFQFINDPGLQSFNSTSIASGNLNVKDHLSELLGLKMVLSVLFLLVVVAIGWFIGYRSGYVVTLLILIGINHVLSTIFMLLRSTLSACGYYRYDSWISALDKMIMIVIIGYFLISKKNEFQLDHFILGQMVSFGAASIAALIIVSKLDIFSIPRFTIQAVIRIIKKSAPYALIMLLMASYNKMDGVMIERLLPEGDYQAGIYAASLRYMDAANMGAYLFAALLLPMFSRLKNQFIAIDDLSRLGIQLMMVFIGFVVVIGITFRSELMSIYDAYDDQYDILLILHLISFAAVGISYIYGTLLTATDHLTSLNKILIAGLLINLLLNLLLIPGMMATGAAIATMTTQWLVMLLQLSLSAKIFALKISGSTVLSIFIFFFISFILINILYLYLPIHWCFSVVLGALFMLFIAFFLGIVRKDMIFALFK